MSFRAGACTPGAQLLFLCFFFSSRRRHTRSLCDWSSDVCSSDLSPLATTLGTSRLRAVKCPVLAASFLSHSQPLSSPCNERMTSYVAFDDDERVGAHCATSPLSLGLSRSSQSRRSATPSRWSFRGCHTSPYGSSAVPTQ